MTRGIIIGTSVALLTVATINNRRKNRMYYGCYGCPDPLPEKLQAKAEECYVKLQGISSDCYCSEINCYGKILKNDKRYKNAIKKLNENKIIKLNDEIKKLNDEIKKLTEQLEEKKEELKQLE